MLTLALLLCAGSGDLPYDTLTLQAGSRADTILAPDLDGDSHPDLIIQSGRDLHVFLYNKDRGFTPQPQQTLRLDGSVHLWTLGTREDRKHPALLTAGSRALQAHPFDGKAFAVKGADLVVHPSLFEGASSETKPPLHMDFAPDLDGDGRSELLLFRQDEMMILKPHAGGDFRCIQKLPLPMDVATLFPWGPHQKVTETTSVPLMAVGDVDGDGRADISYYADEGIGVYRQDKEGRFFPLENRDLTTDKKKRRDRFLKYEVPPRVADFNGDGLLDVALIYPAKGRVQIYYGRGGRADFTQPDDVMQVSDGWCTGIYLEDLNGDKKSDLIMGVVRKFGISGGIEAFLSGRVDIDLHIYPIGENNRFVKDPVQELKFSIPFSFHVTRESASLDLTFRPNFKGDFNKDGLRDLLVAADEKTLKVYPGVRDRVISDQPSATISMPPPAETAYTEPFVADFNKDGVSDLVLKHVLVDPRKHVLELKLSKP